MKVEFIVKDMSLTIPSDGENEMIPAVGIRLLDFPSVLVYLPPTEQSLTDSTTFRFNRGKACQFTADPTSLAARLESSSRPLQVSVLNTSTTPNVNPTVIGTGVLVCDPKLLSSMREWSVSGNGQSSFEGSYIISVFDRAGHNVAIVTLKLRVSHSTTSKAKSTDRHEVREADDQLYSPKSVVADTPAGDTDAAALVPEVDSREGDDNSPVEPIGVVAPSNKEEYLPNSWLPLPLAYKGTNLSCLVQKAYKRCYRKHCRPDMEPSWTETQEHWTALVKTDPNSQPLQSQPPPVTDAPPAMLHANGSIMSQLPLLSAMYSELSLLESVVSNKSLSLHPVMATTGVQTTPVSDTPFSLSPSASVTSRRQEEEPEKSSRQPRRFIRECCDISYLTPTLTSKPANHLITLQPKRRTKKHIHKHKTTSVATANEMSSSHHHQPQQQQQQQQQQTPAKSAPTQPLVEDQPDKEHQQITHTQFRHSPADSQEQLSPGEGVSTNYSDSLEGSSPTHSALSVKQQDSSDLLTDLNKLLIQMSSSERSSSTSPLQQPVVAVSLPLSPSPSSSSSTCSYPKPQSQTRLSRSIPGSLESSAAVLPQLGSQKLYLASSQSLDIAGLTGTAGSSNNTGSSTSADMSVTTQIEDTSTGRQADELPEHSYTSGVEDYSDNFELDTDSINMASNSSPGNIV